MHLRRRIQRCSELSVIHQPEFRAARDDYRGLVSNFEWGALAHLGLARAYALQGDIAKARAAYQDFRTL